MNKKWEPNIRLWETFGTYRFLWGIFVFFMYIPHHLNEDGPTYYWRWLRMLMTKIWKTLMPRKTILMPIEISMQIVTTICILNIGRAWNIIASFIPEGLMWLFWLFVIPLWWITLELLAWHRLRFKFWEHIIRRYVEPWEDIIGYKKSLLVTVVYRCIKVTACFAMIWLTANAIDTRLWTIVEDTLTKLTGGICITVFLFIGQPFVQKAAHYLEPSSWETKEKMVFTIIALVVIGLYGWMGISMFPGLSAPLAFVLAVSIVLTGFFLFLKLLEYGFSKLDSLLPSWVGWSDSRSYSHSWEFPWRESWDLIYVIIRATPTITAVLFWTLVLAQWIPIVHADRVLAKGNQPVEQATQIVVEAPSSTSVPATLTLVPAATSTEEAFTETPMPTFTVGPTNTNTPSPTSNVFSLEGITWDGPSDAPEFETKTQLESVATYQSNTWFVVTNSATKVLERVGDDLVRATEVGRFTNCTINIPGANGYHYEDCFVYSIDEDFTAPGLQNAILFNTTYQYDGKAMYVLPTP